MEKLLCDAFVPSFKISSDKNDACVVAAINAHGGGDGTLRIFVFCFFLSRLILNSPHCDNISAKKGEM